jgi:hypothetical protein
MKLAFVCAMAALFSPSLERSFDHYEALVEMRASMEVQTVSRVGTDGLLAWHSPTSSTLFRLPAGEPIAISIATDDPRSKEQGITGGQLPTLRTQWVDANGVEHEVTTPVQSTTEAGIRRAVQTHEALVDALKTLHPPAPPP